MCALFKRRCKPLHSSWRSEWAEDQYGLSCLCDILQKSALEGDLIIDHVTAETSVLLIQNTVTDTCIAFKALMIHFFQHSCVYVYVIINANLLLTIVQAMQSTNILCKRALPGDWHGQKEGV